MVGRKKIVDKWSKLILLKYPDASRQLVSYHRHKNDPDQVERRKRYYEEKT